MCEVTRRGQEEIDGGKVEEVGHGMVWCRLLAGGWNEHHLNIVEQLRVLGRHHTRCKVDKVLRFGRRGCRERVEDSREGMFRESRG